MPVNTDTLHLLLFACADPEHDDGYAAGICSYHPGHGCVVSLGRNRQPGSAHVVSVRT